MTPTWERLYKIRQLGIYSFAKWTLFVVPLLASCVVFIEHYIKINLALPVNLVMIYFSALLFFASSLMSDLFCPDLIKDHRNFENFFLFVISKADTIGDIRRRAAIAEDELVNQIGEEITKLTGSNEPLDRTKGLFLRLISEVTPTAFVNFSSPAWKDRNHERREVRGMIAAGFMLSAAFALYVTLYDAPRRVLMAAP